MNKSVKHLVAGAALALSPVAHHVGKLTQSNDTGVSSRALNPIVASDTKTQSSYNLQNYLKTTNSKSWDKNRTMKAIAMQESGGGKNTNHREITKGISAGTHAHGQYGLTDSLIRNLVQRSPRLSEKHSALINMDNQHIDEYLKKNPDLENDLMSRYHDRMAKELGTTDPRILYIGHLNGVEGAKKYLEHKSPEDHPLANRVMDFYNKIK